MTVASTLPQTLSNSVVSDVVGRYVSAVFDPNDIIEVRCISTGVIGNVVDQYWMSPGELVAATDSFKKLNAKGFNVFVGVNPRAATGTAKVKAKNCSASRRCGACTLCTVLARMLFVDFDGITVEEARQRIEDANLPAPTLLVNSGHGCHAYWRLLEPLSDWTLWRDLQHALVKRVQSDPKCVDPPRILRLPGFLNCKALPHVLATIEECVPERVYDLGEFPKPKRQSDSSRVQSTSNGQSGDQELARQALALLLPSRADDYGDWIKVGMILHGMDSGNAMLESWDQWSQQSDKWQPCECEYKWNTFSAPDDNKRAVRLGSLIEMARADSGNPDFGRRNRASQRSGDQVNSPKRVTLQSRAPLLVAEVFLNAQHRTADGHATLRRFNGQWWAWDRGYQLLSDEHLSSDLYHFLDHCDVVCADGGAGKNQVAPYTPNKNKIGQVLDALKAHAVIKDSRMPIWLDGRVDPQVESVVAFHNGVLDTDAFVRGETKLLPPSPLWFSGTACPYVFDPDATCSEWMTFIEQTFSGDAESIDLAQEWLGYNMVPDNRYERVMMLVGPPRSGKGSLLEGMYAALGKGQVCTTTFRSIASRFGLAPMVGKLAAFLPDAHVSSSMDSKGALEVIKSVSGNDPQQVDRKCVDALPSVRLPIRFTIAVNELPKLPDEAGALQPRLSLLYFPNSVAGREDPSLKARIRAEAQGIAMWGLMGLRRLRTAGRFTEPARSQAVIAEFHKLVSPVRGFVEDCCELGEEHWVDKDELFGHWKTWCSDRGAEPGLKVQFGQWLIGAFSSVRAGKRGPRGQQFPAYTGIRLCR